jgi:hypothetical protein
MSEKLVAILIHGTFARNAAWIKEDSPLANGLRSVPGVEDVVALEWSGHNTFHARLEAGELLAKLLGKLDASTKAVLCAHSHGGAAICYAIQKNPDLARKIHTVVFFATPFVTCRLLPSWRVLHSTYLATFEITMLAFTYLILGLNLDFFGFNSIVLNSFGLGHLLLLAFLVGFSELALQYVLCRNRGKLKQTHEQLRTALRTAREKSCELPSGLNAKFVRLSGDEASTALVFGQGAAWIALRINALFSWTFSTITKPLRAMRLRHPLRSRLIFYPMSVAILLAFFELRSIGKWESPESSLAHLIWSLSTAGLVLCSIAFISHLVGVFLLILNWLLAIPVGIVSVGLASCLQFSVEAVPPGTWPLSNMTWRAFGVSRRPMFWRHSEAYSDPHVIDDIRGWIQAHKAQAHPT